ncbi:hypothetical protein [Hungatella hathewayi]|uniref:hypothetical protein n=1 Tax=Hungatella hathewayi TaxID=154046 RepID=UPI003569DB65
MLMDILDGILDYNFAIRRGKIVHYYEVIAESREKAVEKAKKNFVREYATSFLRKMVVEHDVVGYPLTKM